MEWAGMRYITERHNPNAGSKRGFERVVADEKWMNRACDDVRHQFFRQCADR